MASKLLKSNIEATILTLTGIIDIGIDVVVTSDGIDGNEAAVTINDIINEEVTPIAIEIDQ